MNTVNIACVKAETPPPTIKYSPTVGADQNFVILKDALKEFSVNAANDPDGDNSKIMYQVKSVTNGSVDPSCFIQIDRTACTFKPDPLNPAAVGVIEYVAIDTEGYSSETATDVSKRVAKVVFEVTQEYSLKVLILGEIGYGELELIEDRTYKKEIYTTAGEYVFCSGIAAGTPVKMKIGRTPLYHVCKIENPEIILTEEMNTVVVNCYEDLSLNEAPVVGPDIERTAYVGQQIKFNILSFFI